MERNVELGRRSGRCSRRRSRFQTIGGLCIECMIVPEVKLKNDCDLHVIKVLLPHTKRRQDREYSKLRCATALATNSE